MKKLKGGFEEMDITEIKTILIISGTDKIKFQYYNMAYNLMSIFCPS